MKQKRQSNLYIKDILGSIKNIREYSSGLTFEKFRNKRIVIDAVVRNLEIIGEAAKNVSEDVKFLHQEIPWKEMSGMRNKIIHEYFGVDLDIVWKTLQTLPSLEIALKKVYRKKEKKAASK